MMLARALLTSFLLAASSAQGVLEEASAAPAEVPAALAADDQCSEVEGLAGGSCALSAVQLRGSLEEDKPSQLLQDAATSSRRRRRHHHHTASYGHKDLSAKVLSEFRDSVKASVARVSSLQKALDKLETKVNGTYGMVAPTGPSVIKKYVSHSAHGSQRRRRRHGAAMAQESVQSLRRRRGLAPRAGTVQDWLDHVQKSLDTDWRRQTRCMRLNGWIMMKLKDPSTPPFQEQMELDEEMELDAQHSRVPLHQQPGSGSDEGEEKEQMEEAELLEVGDNPMEAHMQGQLDEMDKEVEELSTMVSLTAQDAEKTRSLVVQALRGNVTA